MARAALAALLLVAMFAATLLSGTASAAVGLAARASPSLTTQASPDVMTGAVVNDTATLAGGVSPTGAITFTLYGPDDATCAGSAQFVSVEPVTDNGTITSADHVTSIPGTFSWIASYSGDANNLPIAGACDDPNETVMVGIRPVMTGQTSGPVVVGGTISGTANLSGATAPEPPTGSMTVALYPPGDTTCGGDPLQVSTSAVTGYGSYTSAALTAATAGSYRYVSAYSGDYYHTGTTADCEDPHQRVEVTPASPQVDTLASRPVPGGGTMTATVSLSQGFNPTGTITFRLYGPDDASCSRGAIVTSVTSVAGNGDYISAPYIAVESGAFRWVAGYSGDGNNLAVTGACDDPDGNVNVATSGLAPISPTATAHPASRVASPSPSPTLTPAPSLQPTPDPSVLPGVVGRAAPPAPMLGESLYPGSDAVRLGLLVTVLALGGLALAATRRLRRGASPV